jgi:hypothetical protein
MKTNVVRLPQQVGQALAPAGAREKYKLHPTIAEAALIWSGLSFDVLDGCEHLAPGIPDIPSRPEVAARAQALLEATEHGDLACAKHFKPGVVAGEPPEFPEEILEKRTISRKDLLAWIAANFPDEELGAPPAIEASTAAPGEEDRLLSFEELKVTLGGISDSTVWRRIREGKLSPPTLKNPNRWTLSILRADIKAMAEATAAEDI